MSLVSPTFLRIAHLCCAIFLFPRVYSQDIPDSLTTAIQQSLQGNDPLAAAAAFDQLGSYYRSRVLYDSAYSAYAEALLLRDSLDDPSVSLSYLYLGSISSLRMEYRRAIDEFMKAREHAELHHDSLRMSQAYNNLGLQYSYLSVKDSTTHYLKQSIRIKELQGNTAGLAHSYNNLGVLYENFDDLDSALYFYRRGLRLRQVANAPADEVAQSYTNISGVHFDKGQYDSSEFYLQKAMRLIRNDAESDYLKPYIYGIMFELHWENDNKDSARYYLDMVDTVRTQLLNAENTTKLNEIRTRYNVELKDAQLAEQEANLQASKARNRLFMIIAVTASAVLLLFVLFYFYRQRVLLKLLEKDKKLHDQRIDEVLRKQEINVLNAQMDGQEMERHRIAQDLHDRLGSKLSAVKLYMEASQHADLSEHQKSANRLLDETIRETRAIAHNISTGVLAKFGLIAAINNLKSTLENSQKVEIDFVTHKIDLDKIPNEIEQAVYRIIQELFSNILKHAGAGLITIQLSQLRGTLHLTVEDDGKGFRPGDHSEGMGLRNIRSRAEKFNGEVNIDSRPGHGTTVMINIPLE